MIMQRFGTSVFTAILASLVLLPFGVLQVSAAPGDNIKVHIYKYLDGSLATAATTGGYDFPMRSTWRADNLSGGVSASGEYVLGNFHGGAVEEYQADTSFMLAPADYTTTERTVNEDSSSLVLPIGDPCVDGMYRLLGYSSGLSRSEAEAAPLMPTAPVYTAIDVDQYVIVWNEACPVTLPPPPAPVCDNSELVLNGSFELPEVTNPKLWDTFVDLTPGLEWLVELVNGDPATGIEIQAGYAGWVAAEGSQYVELDGDAPNSIYQDIPTIQGENYQISFAFSPRPGTVAADNAVEVVWDGNVIDTVTAVSDVTGMTWSTHTFSGTATGANTRLQLTDAGATANSLGTLIDDVHVVCIPAVTPPPPPPSPTILGVTVVIVNDDGGSLADVGMDILNNSVSLTGSFQAPAGTVPHILTAGTYEVQHAVISGYATTADPSCTGTVVEGDTVFCTVTYDDIASGGGGGSGPVPVPVPPRLIVITNVINNDSGSQTVPEFLMHVTGEEATTSPFSMTAVTTVSFPGNNSGETVSLDPGAYSVTQGNDSGYAVTMSADCTGSILPGEIKTCTVTNDDIPVASGSGGGGSGAPGAGLDLPANPPDAPAPIVLGVSDDASDDASADAAAAEPMLISEPTPEPEVLGATDELLPRTGAPVAMFVAIIGAAAYVARRKK